MTEPDFAALARAVAEEFARIENPDDPQLDSYGDLEALIRGSFSAALKDQQDGPGDRWKCPTCEYTLTKAILRASDGAVGMDTREVQDICPNDGASLRRVTWREDAIDANRVGLEQMKRADEAAAEVAALQVKLHAWREWAQVMYFGGGPVPENTFDMEMRGQIVAAQEDRAAQLQRDLDEQKANRNRDLTAFKHTLHERNQLAEEIDAAWFGIEHGFDIETRAELEQQAKTNGFKFGLAQAVHHLWKRDPKVAPLVAAINDALITTRNYYAQAISKFELERHQDQWRAALGQRSEGGDHADQGRESRPASSKEQV